MSKTTKIWGWIIFLFININLLAIANILQNDRISSLEYVLIETVGEDRLDEIFEKKRLEEVNSNTE